MTPEAVYPKNVRQNLEQLKKEIQIIEQKLSYYDNKHNRKKQEVNLNSNIPCRCCCNKKCDSCITIPTGNKFVTTKGKSPRNKHEVNVQCNIPRTCCCIKKCCSCDSFPLKNKYTTTKLCSPCKPREVNVECNLSHRCCCATKCDSCTMIPVGDNLVTTKVYSPSHVHHRIRIPVSKQQNNTRLLGKENKTSDKLTWNELITNSSAMKNKLYSNRGKDKDDDEKRREKRQIRYDLNQPKARYSFEKQETKSKPEEQKSQNSRGKPEASKIRELLKPPVSRLSHEKEETQPRLKKPETENRLEKEITQNWLEKLKTKPDIQDQQNKPEKPGAEKKTETRESQTDMEIDNNREKQSTKNRPEKQKTQKKTDKQEQEISKRLDSQGTRNSQEVREEPVKKSSRNWQDELEALNHQDEVVKIVVTELQKELREALAAKVAAEKQAAVCELTGEKMKVLLEANAACSAHNARSVQDLERRLEEQLCLERRDATSAQVNGVLQRMRAHALDDSSSSPHELSSMETVPPLSISSTRPSRPSASSYSSRRIRHSSPTESQQAGVTQPSWNDVSSIKDETFVTIEIPL